MISNGILLKADPNEVRRYLPLLAVVDLDRESTKVRVCMDSKVKYKGINLNIYIYISSHKNHKNLHTIL